MAKCLMTLALIAAGVTESQPHLPRASSPPRSVSPMAAAGSTSTSTWPEIPAASWWTAPDTPPTAGAPPAPHEWDHPLFVEFVEDTIPAEPDEPPRAPSLRDRALARLRTLGAPESTIPTWDCIGHRESGWQNVTSRPNWDGSVDRGPLQINSRWHDAELARRGLDPYVPEDAAEYAYGLYRRSGFSPWTVAPLCGVR